MAQMNLSMKQKLTCIEFRLMVVKREGGHGGQIGNLGLGM